MFDQKRYKKNFQLYFFPIFGHQTLEPNFDPKKRSAVFFPIFGYETLEPNLDPDSLKKPDPDSLNPDPQHCLP
jgi:hypothetical protein